MWEWEEGAYRKVWSEASLSPLKVVFDQESMLERKVSLYSAAKSLNVAMLAKPVMELIRC